MRGCFVSGSSIILPIALAAAYLLLIGLLMGRKSERLGVGTQQHWLLMTLIAAAVGVCIYLLPDESPRPALSVIVVNLMIVLFGGQTLRNVHNRQARLWTALALIWWAASAALIAVTKDPKVGEEGWLGEIYSPLVLPGIVVIAGWLVIAGMLLMAAFYAFYKAHLPEVANRALFWAILIPMVIMGAVLGTSGSPILSEIGWLVQFVGLVGAVYCVKSYRVFDIRRLLRQTAATSLMTSLTGLVLFVVLVIAYQLDPKSDSAYLVLALIALAGALLFVPLRTINQFMAQRVFGSPAEAVSQLLRQFSEDITGVVELDALAEVTMRPLSQLLRVKRGGLILVSEEGPVADGPDALRLDPVRTGIGEIPDIAGRISCDSPICYRLLRSRAPLLQYDLDFGRMYSEIAPDERRFFSQMRMSAYAPVVVQGQLIGILCSGAKTSDAPFTERDLELLMTIANQAAVALRNARLVSDLRRREMEQADLNKELSATTEQLERLDGVKTDFITIASHELRTPLAQIRGYTDIMEAMNEQQMLDQDQITGMTANLRKAADRLENLIGAMLDVSQLDVDAMDLRFSHTSIENVMRMAIEPLTESIQARKLMLSARGLRGLPPIQADMQRLVQAFRNVVLNAIKFTPDGGRIDISGRMQGDELIVMIKDTGVGIDPQNHELIFKKFFRAHDPSLHSTGTTKFMGAGPGLGLTIARGVIEGHGGRIWAESPKYDPQKMPGSTFYIALPLNPPAEAKRVKPFETGINMRVPEAAFGGTSSAVDHIFGGSFSEGSK